MDVYDMKVERRSWEKRKRFKWIRRIREGNGIYVKLNEKRGREV